MRTFWSCWRRKKGKCVNKPSHVERLSSDSDIAQAFADHFKQPLGRAPIGNNTVYSSTETIGERRATKGDKRRRPMMKGTKDKRAEVRRLTSFERFICVRENFV